MCLSRKLVTFLKAELLGNGVISGMMNLAELHHATGVDLALGGAVMADDTENSLSLSSLSLTFTQDKRPAPNPIFCCILEY